MSKYFKVGSDTLKSFTENWKALGEDARYQLRKGLGNGTFDYDPKEKAPAASTPA